MTTEPRVSRKKAATALGVSEAHLKNFILAGEFGIVAPREKLRVSELERWATDRPIIELSETAYVNSLRYAVSEFYLGGSKSDFGSSTRRTAGKFVDDQTSGKLGEIAVAQYLREYHGLVANLDFVHHGGIPAQDIESIGRVGKRSFNPPRIRTSIKTSKGGNTLLLVPETEFASPDRRSDVYLFVRVSLPGDHIIRRLYQSGGLTGIEGELGNKIKLLDEPVSVAAQIAGFAWHGDFTEDAVSQVGMLNLAKPNRVLTTGRLRVSGTDWSDLARRLVD